MICVDNSEFMRNGDYLPTRLQAQQDAVNLIAHSKTRANPESNVALMTLSDLSVLVTLTTDTGKLLAKLSKVGPTGDLRFISGIKIAHLALKHRQGKNHKTRIIAFVGSPIEQADEKDLVKLAKKLKKEKVNVDIINIGEEESNTNLLNKFVETINGKEGTSSHLVTIPPVNNLTDALVSSPILQGEDGGSAAPGGGGYEFGVDPNDDPELALALRVSMEEQRARQNADSGPGGVTSPGGQEAAPATPGQPATGEDTSEEAMLQRALAMSMDGGEGEAPSAGADLGAMSEEEQIAYAMRMSMAEGSSEGGAKSGGAESMEVDDKATEDEDYSEVMNDPAFLQSVLQNLPGVDPQSEAIKNAVGSVKDEKKDDKSKDKESK